MEWSGESLLLANGGDPSIHRLLVNLLQQIQVRGFGWHAP